MGLSNVTLTADWTAESDNFSSTTSRITLGGSNGGVGKAKSPPAPLKTYTASQVGVSWQQVDCNPPGNIVVEVVDSRAGDGGFIAIALESVQPLYLIFPTPVDLLCRERLVSFETGRANRGESRGIPNYGEGPCMFDNTWLLLQVGGDGIIKNMEIMGAVRTFWHQSA